MYESSDYSKDGEVTALQTATRGNGINIVLLGDAFSDRLVADGTYDGTMRKAMEHFFSEEPYKSFRDLFNVYAVNVVSKTKHTVPVRRLRWTDFSATEPMSAATMTNVGNTL